MPESSTNGNSTAETTAQATADVKAIVAKELVAAASPLQSFLSTVGTGDGTPESAVAAWASLQGNLPQVALNLQKIGINNVAADLNTLFTDYLNDKVAELTAAPSPAPAPAPSPETESSSSGSGSSED